MGVISKPPSVFVIPKLPEIIEKKLERLDLDYQTELKRSKFVFAKFSNQAYFDKFLG